MNETMKGESPASEGMKVETPGSEGMKNETSGSEGMKAKISDRRSKAESGCDTVKEKRLIHQTVKE